MYDLTGVLEHLEKARLDQELKTAAQVQNALLSRTVKQGQYYEAVGDSVACRTIGGDFFELLELPSGDFGMVLGDVAGKGPPAALLASMLQGMFTVEARIGSSPAQAMTNINSALAAKDLGPRFATVVYGLLGRDGEFICSNAGHNAPIVLGRDGIQRCDAGGPILGAFRDSAYGEQILHLQRGDVIVMFTDGVTEARNQAGEEFGEERLVACVNSLRERSAFDIAKGILDSVREFSREAAPADDITVAVMRRR
jgi:serine phosphatase RsbU (regulator of sigma subunit)